MVAHLNYTDTDFVLAMDFDCNFNENYNLWTYCFYRSCQMHQYNLAPWQPRKQGYKQITKRLPAEVAYRFSPRWSLSLLGPSENFTKIIHHYHRLQTKSTWRDVTSVVNIGSRRRRRRGVRAQANASLPASSVQYL